MPDSSTHKPSGQIKSILSQCPANLVTYQRGVPTFHPESAQDAADFFALCHDAKQPVYITGFGNNIDPVGERFEQLIVVRTDRLGAIRSVDAEELTIDVGSGFPVRELNVKLADSGVFFPLANVPYVGSVGGATAVNLSAGLDPQYWREKTGPGGATAPFIDLQRYLLELEVVTPTGEVKQFGVPNNNISTGENYARIFSPSWGQFGLIVAVKLRLLPESAQVEYGSLTQMAVSRSEFVSEFADRKKSYLARIKEKFDPAGVLTVEALHGCDFSKS